MQSKTFRDMYEDLKGSVWDIDARLGTWLSERRDKIREELQEANQ